jgi:hypothetical protein
MLPSKITEKINDELFMSMNNILLKELHKNTPVKSSDTANAWKIKKGEALGEFIISNPRGNIVTYLEEGTKPHKIRPKNVKMLKFELVDKNGKPMKPSFKKASDAKMFNQNGVIFYYNKGGVPVLGYVKEGSKYYCFAKEVKHPGTEGRWFFRKTLTDEDMWHRIYKDVEAKIN